MNTLRVLLGFGVVPLRGGKPVCSDSARAMAADRGLPALRAESQDYEQLNLEH